MDAPTDSSQHSDSPEDLAATIAHINATLASQQVNPPSTATPNTTTAPPAPSNVELQAAFATAVQSAQQQAQRQFSMPAPVQQRTFEFGADTRMRRAPAETPPPAHPHSPTRAAEDSGAWFDGNSHGHSSGGDSDGPDEHIGLGLLQSFMQERQQQQQQQGAGGVAGECHSSSSGGSSGAAPGEQARLVQLRRLREARQASEEAAGQQHDMGTQEARSIQLERLFAQSDTASDEAGRLRTAAAASAGGGPPASWGATTGALPTGFGQSDTSVLPGRSGLVAALQSRISRLSSTAAGQTSEASEGISQFLDSPNILQQLSQASQDPASLRSLLGEVAAAATGAASAPPVPVPGQPPAGASNWAERAEALQELCTDLQKPVTTDNLQKIRECLAFLADVANAESPRNWSSGSLLKDMSEAAAKCVFGVLEVCLHAKFGPFEPALYSLVQHCPDEPVLVEASRLFWYFSRSDANKPAMLIAGHLAVVCNAIAAHVHMPRVLFHLVVGLSNVALSTEAADALAALGIFEEVASAAEKNADQLQVQLPTCVLIGHMLRHTRDDDAGRQAEKNMALVETCIESGCYKAIQRMAAAVDGNDKFAGSAMTGASLFVSYGGLPAQAALLRDNGLSVWLGCLHRFHADRASIGDAWRSLLVLLECILSKESSALEEAVAQAPDGLSLLSRSMELSNLGPVEQLLQKLFSHRLSRCPEDVALRIVPQCRHSLPLLQLLHARHTSLHITHLSTILQRLLQVCFNGKQRQLAADWSVGTLQLLSVILMEHGANAEVVEAAIGVVWLLCFVDSVKTAVKDDQSNILSLLHTAHATMSTNGPVQERFSAIRAMCKLGGGNSSAGYGW